MFLGVTARVEMGDDKEFSLILDENPLLDFVELPQNLSTSLWYDNIICGVIRGALEMVQVRRNWGKEGERKRVKRKND